MTKISLIHGAGSQKKHKQRRVEVDHGKRGEGHDPVQRQQGVERTPRRDERHLPVCKVGAFEFLIIINFMNLIPIN